MQSKELKHEGELSFSPFADTDMEALLSKKISYDCTPSSVESDGSIYNDSCSTTHTYN